MCAIDMLSGDIEFESRRGRITHCVQLDHEWEQLIACTMTDSKQPLFVMVAHADRKRAAITVPWGKGWPGLYVRYQPDTQADVLPEPTRSGREAQVPPHQGLHAQTCQVESHDPVTEVSQALPKGAVQPPAERDIQRGKP